MAGETTFLLLIGVSKMTSAMSSKCNGPIGSSLAMTLKSIGSHHNEDTQTSLSGLHVQRCLEREYLKVLLRNDFSSYQD